MPSGAQFPSIHWTFTPGHRISVQDPRIKVTMCEFERWHGRPHQSGEASVQKEFDWNMIAALNFQVPIMVQLEFLCFNLLNDFVVTMALSLKFYLIVASSPNLHRNKATRRLRKGTKDVLAEEYCGHHDKAWLASEKDSIGSPYNQQGISLCL